MVLPNRGAVAAFLIVILASRIWVEVGARGLFNAVHPNGGLFVVLKYRRFRLGCALGGIIAIDLAGCAQRGFTIVFAVSCQLFLVFVGPLDGAIWFITVEPLARALAVVSTSSQQGAGRGDESEKCGAHSHETSGHQPPLIGSRWRGQVSFVLNTTSPAAF